ncbi:putative zinc finger protein [Phaeoacremonium minimum UCRPA7]|uniref:Putative zinc finger protein n=1 Tax=Phaeoacremonium minimum (strain UCR-PA7) TaxID=1286976 RepID=R8BHY7_PHAM7|nr:putative zinc finger protein [Phaeoacremonium minimum UCRPA7]EON98955.1 putative zinc finger protein [Phaeoacremonium minimum UCRPA7]
MSTVNHFKDVCHYGDCRESWPSDQMACDHEINDHHYCRDCDRTFMNLNNIRMHLKSRAHLGQTIGCPFCSKAFTTATGLIHHLENGACPQASHIDRDSIYRFVRLKDPGGLISKNIIGWTGSEQYEASKKAWNGYGYECRLCHREFKALNSLNQHLNSPVHQQNLYHCPNAGCRQDFKNLAGIINHLESESCGFTRFDNV